MKRPSIDLRATGWDGLAFAVVEQAVQDLRWLRHCGLIRGCRVARRWPKERGLPTMLRDYSRRSAAVDLIAWLRDQAGLALEEAGSRIDGAELRRWLGV